MRDGLALTILLLYRICLIQVDWFVACQ